MTPTRTASPTPPAAPTPTASPMPTDTPTPTPTTQTTPAATPTESSTLSPTATGTPSPSPASTGTPAASPTPVPNPDSLSGKLSPMLGQSGNVPTPDGPDFTEVVRDIAAQTYARVTGSTLAADYVNIGILTNDEWNPFIDDLDAKYGLTTSSSARSSRGLNIDVRSHRSLVGHNIAFSLIHSEYPFGSVISGTLHEMGHGRQFTLGAGGSYQNHHLLSTNAIREAAALSFAGTGVRNLASLDSRLQHDFRRSDLSDLLDDELSGTSTQTHRTGRNYLWMIVWNNAAFSSEKSELLSAGRLSSGSLYRLHTHVINMPEAEAATLEEDRASFFELQREALRELIIGRTSNSGTSPIPPSSDLYLP